MGMTITTKDKGIIDSIIPVQKKVKCKGKLVKRILWYIPFHFSLHIPCIYLMVNLV